MGLIKYLLTALLTVISFNCYAGSVIVVSSDSYKQNPFTRQNDMFHAWEEDLLSGNTNYANSAAVAASTRALSIAISTNSLANTTYFLNISSVTQTKDGSLNILSSVGVGTTTTTRQLSIKGGEWVQLIDSGNVPKWHINDFSGLGLNFAETNVADARLFLAPGGNIGIGTSGPREKLEIANGTLSIPNNTGLQGRNAANTGSVTMMFVGGDDSVGVGLPSAGSGFYNGGYRVFINSSGQTVIGGTNLQPTSQLDVSGGSVTIRGTGAALGVAGVDILNAMRSSAALSSQQFQSAFSSISVLQTATGTLYSLLAASSSLDSQRFNSAFSSITLLQTATSTLYSLISATSTNAVRVDGSSQSKTGTLNVGGRFGVGTTTPTSSIDVAVGSATIRGSAAGLAIRNNNTSAELNITQDTLGFGSLSNLAGTMQYFSGTNSGHNFYINGDIATPRLLFTSAGNLLLTDTPTSASSKVDIVAGSMTIRGTGAGLSVAGTFSAGVTTTPYTLQQLSTGAFQLRNSAGENSYFSGSTHTFYSDANTSTPTLRLDRNGARLVGTFSAGVTTTPYTLQQLSTGTVQLRNRAGQNEYFSGASHVFYADANTSTQTFRIDRNGLTVQNSTAPIISLLRNNYVEAPTINDRIGALNMALLVTQPLSGIESYQEAGTTFNNGDLRFYTSADFGNLYRERMRINRSGNVGIGTAVPAYKAHVEGDIYGSFILRQNGTYTNGSSYSDANWGWLMRSAQISPNLAIFAIADTNDYKWFLIDPSGRVGINTTSPNVRFEVAGGSIAVQTESAYLVKTADQSHGLKFGGVTWDGVNIDGPVMFGWTDGALGTKSGGNRTALRWNSNGNIGINTSNPISKLHVRAATNKNLIFDDNYAYTGAFQIAAINDSNTGLVPLELRANPLAISGNTQIKEGRLLVHQSGGTGYSGVIELGNGSTTNYIFTGGTGDGTRGDLYIYSASTQNVLLQAGGGTTGNVGVNTLTPTVKLQVNEFDDLSDRQISARQGHPSSKAGVEIYNSNGSGALYLQQDPAGVGIVNNTGGGLQFFSATNNGVDFYTNGVVLTPSVSIGKTGDVSFSSATVLAEISGNPSPPTSGGQTKVYVKGDKYIIQYNDAGTVKYRYMDLTSTNANWTYTTTAP